MNTEARFLVVTGASTGFGAVTARSAVRAGWRVLATTRNPEAAAALREAGCETATLDLRDGGSIDSAAETIRDWCGGRLDALINNAGTVVPAPVELCDLDEVRSLFETNVFGHIHLTQRLLPALRQARGRVIMVSSEGAVLGTPLLGAYAASKRALEAFAEVLALELDESGVGVHVVAPGPYDTGIWARMSEGRRRNPLEGTDYGKFLPFLLDGFDRDPQPVADLLLRLASEGGSRFRYAIPKSSGAKSAVRPLLPMSTYRWVLRKALAAQGSAAPASNGAAADPDGRSRAARPLFRRLGAHDYLYLCQDTEATPRNMVFAFRYDPSADLDAALGRIRANARAVPLLRARLRQPLGGAGRPVLYAPEELGELPLTIDDTAVAEDQLDAYVAEYGGQRFDLAGLLWGCRAVRLAGGGFALAFKFHHALVDGLGGSAMCAVLLGNRAMPEGDAGWQVVDDERRLASRYVADAGRALLASPARIGRAVAGLRGSSLADGASVVKGMQLVGRPCPSTPLNLERVAPGRVMQTVAFPVEAIRRFSERHGCTVNDVVLAATCTAMRDELFAREGRVPGVKVWVPVGTPPENDGDLVGNVKMTLRLLSFDADDAPSREAFFLQMIEEVKRSKQRKGVEVAGAASVGLLGALPAPLIRRISNPANVNRVANALVSSLRIDPGDVAVDGSAPVGMQCFGAIENGLSWVVVPLRTPDTVYVSFTADAALKGEIGRLRDGLEEVLA